MQKFSERNNISLSRELKQNPAVKVDQFVMTTTKTQHWTSEALTVLIIREALNHVKSRLPHTKQVYIWILLLWNQLANWFK